MRYLIVAIFFLLLSCKKEEDSKIAKVTIIGDQSAFVSIRLNGNERALIQPLRQDTSETREIECNEYDWPVISAKRDEKMGKIKLIVEYEGRVLVDSVTGTNGVLASVILRQN